MSTGWIESRSSTAAKMGSIPQQCANRHKVNLVKLCVNPTRVFARVITPTQRSPMWRKSIFPSAKLGVKSPLESVIILSYTKSFHGRASSSFVSGLAPFSPPNQVLHFLWFKIRDRNVPFVCMPMFIVCSVWTIPLPLDFFYPLHLFLWHPHDQVQISDTLLQGARTNDVCDRRTAVSSLTLQVCWLRSGQMSEATKPAGKSARPNHACLTFVANPIESKISSAPPAHPRFSFNSVKQLTFNLQLQAHTAW